MAELNNGIMIDIKEKYLGKIAALLSLPVDRLSIEGVLSREPGEYRWGFADKPQMYKILYRNDNNYLYQVAKWWMVSLPGSCAYVVCYHSEVTYGNKGLGTLLNEMKQDIAKNIGYTAMICSDVTKNTFQKKILAKHEWADVHTLTNRRTNNEIKLYVKDLDYGKEETKTETQEIRVLTLSDADLPTVDAPTPTV